MEKNNELTFEQQMRLNEARRNTSELAAKADELSKRLERYSEAVQDAEDLADDPMRCKAALFTHAEWFDALKPLASTDKDLHHELALQIDWLRHVVDDKPYAVKDAVTALRKCVAGDIYGSMEIFTKKVNVRQREFYNIVEYWKEALEID